MRYSWLKYIRQFGISGKTKEAIEQTLHLAKFLCLLHVYGPSMLPTLNLTGDVVVVERVSPLMGKLECGDIVVIRSPDNPRKTISKRILGLEGDRLTFLPDPNHSDARATLTVPKGHVWVQGDNIYASKDSRQLGPIPYGLVLGRVFFRVWPPDDFGSL